MTNTQQDRHINLRQRPSKGIPKILSEYHSWQRHLQVCLEVLWRRLTEKTVNYKPSSDIMRTREIVDPNRHSTEGVSLPSWIINHGTDLESAPLMTGLPCSTVHSGPLCSGARRSATECTLAPDQVSTPYEKVWPG